MIGPSLVGGLILGLERSQAGDLIRRRGEQSQQDIKLDLWTLDMEQGRVLGGKVGGMTNEKNENFLCI